MSVLDLRPAQLDIQRRPGDDLALTATVTGLTLTSPTVTAPILNRDGTNAAVASFTVSTAGQAITLALTQAQTTTLGLGSYTWSMTVTVGTDTGTLLAGTLVITNNPTRSGTTSAVAVNTGTADVTIEVAWGGATDIDGGTAAGTGSSIIDGGSA